MMYDPTTKTAAEWREMAASRHRDRAESWDRCDTDGYLSQWAAQEMARRFETLAEMAENGGVWGFAGLADLDGNLLDARYVQTRFGWAWAINTDAGTVWFNESNARNGQRRRATHASKGYRLVTVYRPALMADDGNIIPKRGGEVAKVEEATYHDY